MNTLLLVALHYPEYSYGLALALSRYQPVVLVLSRPSLQREMAPLQLEAGPNLRLTVVAGNRGIRPLISSCWSILGLIIRLKPSIVHFQEVFNELQVFALLCCIARGCSTVLTVHDPTPHAGGDTRSLNSIWRPRRLYRWLQRRLVSGFVVHSSCMIPVLRPLVPRGRPIAVAPHGPLGLLVPQGDPVNQPPKKVFRALMLGRMMQYKGLDLFVEAIENLRNKGIPLVGVIAGQGEELDRLKPQLCHNDAFEIIHTFLTPIQIAEVIDQASVLVLPYREATQSGVAAYGLGRGVPIIATNVGGLPDMVQHSITGLLIPPDDPVALTDALATLYHHPHLCRDMASAARRHGKDIMSWHRAADATLVHYGALEAAH